MAGHRTIPRLVLVGVAAAAVAAPGAGAGVTPGTYVQIDGKLVNPEHLSAYEARAGSPRSGPFVQIGGTLVRPDQVSAYQAELSKPAPVVKVDSDSDGIGWTSTGIGVVVLASLLLVAGMFGALWRRWRLSTV
jgi:hypothetical protein